MQEQLPKDVAVEQAGQELLPQFIACSAIYKGGQIAGFAHLDLLPFVP